MKHYLLLSIAVLICSLFMAQLPSMEENFTPEYADLIQMYKDIASKSDMAELQEWGMTDAGHPLHVLVVNTSKVFSPEKFDKNKAIFLINNAIHPGEPCGVNASLHIAQEMALEGKLPKDVILAIIPAYNIGGMLNRGSHSRANQNGPEAYGFRGNARNYDLNRDFVKADSKNALSFMEIFHSLQPHVMLDTHTSNGADYQHTMTLITSQPDMAGPIIGHYAQNTMTPALMESMANKDWPMCPYVNSFKDTPDQGIRDLDDSPRYSTGYGSQFNCLSYISEAHMLKPFPDRVKSTYELIHAMIDFTHANASTVIFNKKKADEETMTQIAYDIQWQLDTTTHTSTPFMGYKSSYKHSKVTTGKRLKYNRNQPYEESIPYYNRFVSKKNIEAPRQYIIPAAWSPIVDRLQVNGVRMTPLKQDTTLHVFAYFIEDLETKKNPFEGHYLHFNTTAVKRQQDIRFHKGDFLVSCNQIGNKYIVSTLEPEATDSYFNWNFFDAILQQKEWYSPYVFEDKAEAMLDNDPELKADFEDQMKSDPEFAKNPRNQLYWLYRHSENFEPNYRRYPIYRVE